MDLLTIPQAIDHCERQRVPERRKRLVRASTLCALNLAISFDRSSGTASVCSLPAYTYTLGEMQIEHGRD